jgi:hypothetical protein
MGTHREVEDEAAAPVERYAASWKFLILVELAKLALVNPERPQNATADACTKVLSDFIRTNWGQLDFRFTDIFKKRHYSFKFEPTVLGNKLGALDVSQVPRKQLAGVLREANAWIQTMLGVLLSSDHWYYVLFDDLDRGFDPGDDEYLARTVGLLLAAREIFNWSQERKLLAAPIVFIRSDIYEHLSFPDKNKITQNLVETLSWTDEYTGDDSLKALIDQRIRAITQTESDDPWGEVFDPQAMRGTQKKYKHIAARTYLRPRDMIQFCNLCLAEAKKERADLIENHHIGKARTPYSEYLVNELDDEIHETAADWQDLLNVLRRVHKMRFDRDIFRKAFHDTGRSSSNADDALELLYQFSILGFTKIGGGGYGGSAVAFRYKSPGVSFDPSATYFNVHPGLKEALELVESGE